ncbi:MAG: beta-lactamase family protein [Clostridia bacterium]|nr:beta-lactamase family protein [Oscillospiraceae bacterium]MBQ7960259.1 beta-lactamase family protein [Clostridia bacterium]
MNFTKLKNYMDVLLEKYHVPGVDCIVYKEHEMVFRYFAGMSDIENNKRMTGDELYLIFSMTKMLTCTCALQLFEQGKYLMDDCVSKYLPEFEKMRISSDFTENTNAKEITTGSTSGENITLTENGYAKNPITIKDLFTMGAGLDYDLNAKGIKDALSKGQTSTRELVGAISQTVLGFEPGTRFRYSLCHDVLGALIEVWSGKTFGEYMKENIFEPLGMSNTFFGLPKDEKTLSRMAARYIHDENKLPKRLPLECAYILSDEYQSGGAGLTSCADDYALFLDALSCGGIGKNGNRILSSATVELMKTNHLTGKQIDDFYLLRPGYGYGLGVRTHLDPTRSGSLSPIGEFGWDGAAGAFSMVDTKNQLSMTYFQHIHNWDVRIQTEMRNALYSCLD